MSVVCHDPPSNWSGYSCETRRKGKRETAGEQLRPPPSSPFSQNQPEKGHIVNQIAPPHPSRFLNKSEEPFQPAFLHPSRCAFYQSGNDIKRSTHTHNKGRLQ